MKKQVVTMGCMALLFCGLVQAGDNPREAGRRFGPHTQVAPAPGPGEYVTDDDNQDSAGSGSPDGDMDVYLFNTDPLAPIEFDITIPNPNGRAGTLRLDNYDVDASSGEVDEVYVNGVKVGVLNGESDAVFTNSFSIPAGVLVPGKNRVQVLIDVANPNGAVWAVSIDYGIIKLIGTKQNPLITRAWVSPVEATAGSTVNFFAEVSAKADSVEVYDKNNAVIATLTDPDGDGTWSGAYVVPSSTITLGFKMGVLKNGNVKARWPALIVK